jgi:hypothetical protein
VETLTVGEHHITASATDTSGMSADVTLSVVVTASGGLVPVASVNPEPGAPATPSSNATPEPAIVAPSEDPTASGGLPIGLFALVAIALGSAAVGGWIVLRRQKLRRGGR